VNSSVTLHKCTDPSTLLKPSCCHLQGFSPGTYQLYACALDTMGARSCQTASITVSPPAVVTPAEVTSAVTKVKDINIGQLKATGEHTTVAGENMHVAPW
jgi:hypothetical protein